MEMRSTVLAVSLVVLSFVLLSAGEGYNGYKLYDVTPSTQTQVAVLGALAAQDHLYDFFTLSRLPGRKARVMLAPEVEQAFLHTLQQHQIHFELVNANVAQALQEAWHHSQLLRKRLPYKGQGRLSTERYYAHDEINAYIEDLAKRYPERVFLKTFGKSYEKRLLKTLTITNGDGRTNKNVILMDGGFHAREWISPASVVYAIGELVENFSANADLLKDYDWVVLPVVNADGYEYSRQTAETRSWRKTRQPWLHEGRTCYGTDPNRNFDFQWSGDGSSPEPCSNTYAGPRPFSEPEAVVVRDLIHALKERGIMYLTIHSYGQYLLYPWGWTTDLPDTWEDLHEVAMAGADAIYAYSGTNYTVGSSTNVLYVAAGASDDYAFNAGFPISFTMELPGGGPTGFDPPESSIDTLVKETWVGIRAMAVKVMEKYPLKKYSNV